MTLNTKRSKGIDYLYFQAGTESIYIGPKGRPAKAKQANVVRALDYSQERAEHYLDSLEELLPFLPLDARKEYVSRHTGRLNGRIKRHMAKTTRG